MNIHSSDKMNVHSGDKMNVQSGDEMNVHSGDKMNIHSGDKMNIHIQNECLQLCHCLLCYFLFLNSTKLLIHSNIVNICTHIVNKNK